MKRALNSFLRVAVFGPLLLFLTLSTEAYASDETIASRTAEITASICIT
jgi:hypothetical protein